MAAPLISIITPAYNHEKYISDCIRSALAQTHTNWEMIIVDDGSTDRTGEIARSFFDPRIKYFHQTHQGGYKLGATYNKALQEAKGELVAILEGDDFWPPDKLAIQAPYFDNPDIILTYGDCVITNESGQHLFYRRIPTDVNIRDNSPIGSALNGFIRAENFIYAQTVMVRKSALLKTGGFVQPDYLHLVDFPTWCRLSLDGQFKAIPHLLGFWRRNIKSVTMNNPAVVSAEFICYIDEFLTQHKERIRTIRVDINQNKIRETLNARLRDSGRQQNYAKALTLFIYGYNQPARQHFGLYLRQPDKNIFNSIISLTAVIISYTNILSLVLPLAGVYCSDWLASIKKKLV